MEQILAITFGSLSDRGMIREDNQDCYGKYPEDSTELTTPDGQLFIIADGMGGHRGGQEASQMAVNIIQQVYFTSTAQDVLERLEEAFEVANSQIYQLATTNPKLHGMGTTCTALVLKDSSGYIAHVGDSRAYRISRTKIEQLTQDHSQVAELHRRGILTEKEAMEHPNRSILNRALGVDTTVKVDLIDVMTLKAGEHYVLCTDGLAKVENKEIKSIVLSNSPQQACEKLIKMANERGGEDNVTVQVIRIDTSK